MENLIVYQTIEKHRKEFAGRIFTTLQLDILKKKLEKKALNSNEKTYYYKYIKPKINAMFLLTGITKTHISGKEYMLKERILSAEKILAQMSRKHKPHNILISGSFLFNKKYNDIDVFVFTTYKKEDYRMGKIHVNFLPETALDSLFFSSLQQICISNFSPITKKEFTVLVEDLLQSYEILINDIMNKKKCTQKLRQFLLEAEYYSKRVILHSKQLHTLQETITKKKMIALLSDTLVNALAYGSTEKIFHNTLLQRMKDYENLLKQYKYANNIKEYLKTYQEAINIGV